MNLADANSAFVLDSLFHTVRLCGAAGGGTSFELTDS
jgi:hypothetical protein